jgi:hypothetical protein
MTAIRTALLAALGLTIGQAALTADGPTKRTPREALQPLNDLIGTWRGTGEPAGTLAERQRGFWEEKLTWGWQFKGKDAWLSVTFVKGKHFESGELRYLPDKDLFQLTLRTPSKETQTFTGRLKERILTLDREDEKTKEGQRLVITMLHFERHLYRVDVKPEGKGFFRKAYGVGATRDGVKFAQGDGRPECVVSGGLGTTPVTYMGQTYYVCCSGCRDEFNADPAKYVKEYLARKAKKGK